MHAANRNLWQLPEHALTYLAQEGHRSRALQRFRPRKLGKPFAASVIAPGKSESGCERTNGDEKSESAKSRVWRHLYEKRPSLLAFLESSEKNPCLPANTEARAALRQNINHFSYFRD